MKAGFILAVVLFCVAFVDQLCDYHGVIFDWKTFKCWKRLDLRGPVPDWFSLSVAFLCDVAFFPVGSSILRGLGAPLNILKSQNFKLVCDCLSCVSAGSLSVYTDSSLKNLGTIQRKTSAAVFFEDIGLSLGIRVTGLLSSTLVELQAIALALECVLSFSLICLYSDSQAALDTCKSKLHLICPDFCVWYWVEHQHIVDIICCKNLRMEWVKMKNYLSVIGNDHADTLTAIAFSSDWHLLPCLKKYCLSANGVLVSGNSRHFVQDVFRSVYHAH
ncbi:hypothetical protein G9A89_014977 [Geosiphon pyriformis]|nr:hypothetical protein G9A89_014977 [Geosiphon pyriformis]